MSGRLNPLNKRGDTLVEVLLAMAIVTTVLGGAYVSSNNSLNSTQVSKERDIALRVAETQLERIRAFRSVNSGAVSNGSCMDASLGVVSNGGALAPLDTDTLTGSPGAYSAACIVDGTSATYAAGVDSTPYHVYNEVSGSDYTIHVRWERSGGGQNQETTIRYRSH